MGCCTRTQDKVVIKSASIPLTCQESLEEKENNLKNNSHIIINSVIPKQIMKLDKTPDLKFLKRRSTAEKQNIKSMHLLRNISFNEVYECPKYFL